MKCHCTVLGCIGYALDPAASASTVELRSSPSATRSGPYSQVDRGTNRQRAVKGMVFTWVSKETDADIKPHEVPNGPTTSSGGHQSPYWHMFWRDLMQKSASFEPDASEYP